MCKNHRINCLINSLKISINEITEFIFIFMKIGKYYCMHFFFVRYISSYYLTIFNIYRVQIVIVYSCYITSLPPLHMSTLFTEIILLRHCRIIISLIFSGVKHKAEQKTLPISKTWCDSYVTPVRRKPKGVG